jgi:DNA polymerase (family 10)
MTNADVARVFAEIADLLEIQGGDSFRVSSYRRVSRAIEDLVGDVSAVAAAGELEQIAGVGRASAEKIRELLSTGKVAVREKLAREVPVSLLELLRIPGLGPKKAAVLWKERGITSLADLKQALQAGALADLKGFAQKTIDHMREGLEFIERTAGRTRLGDAWPLAEALRAAVLAIPGVARVEHAGSLRRGCETIGDLDLLCEADDGAAVIERFAQLDGVTRVLVAGDTKGSVLMRWRGDRDIQVDLRVVPAASFGAAWQYFTGSKQHNVRLRELAVRRGWTLNEYALADAKTNDVIAARAEEDVYAALGLPCFPPELREDRFEFELERVPSDLLTMADIRGELHCHTTASDGRQSIEEMAAAARARGYAYLCITDHSVSSVIANGLSVERLLEHAGQVRRAARKLKGFALLVGAEVDVHADGSLDYPDDVLAQLDFVVASLHVGLSHDPEANTRRTLAAIRNPYVNLVAHPTGRLINRRDAAPLDVAAVAREAARTGTALEINANYLRLDLKDTQAREARACGALLCINCDAHDGASFDQMRFGVMTARRAGLQRPDVLNTRSAEEVADFVRRKRAAAASPRSS